MLGDHFDQAIRERVDLVGGVGRHRGDAKPRAAAGHRGVANALHVEAALEQCFADLHRAFVVAENDGHDMGSRRLARKPRRGESLAQVCGVALQLPAAPEPLKWGRRKSGPIIQMDLYTDGQIANLFTKQRKGGGGPKTRKAGSEAKEMRLP